MKLLFRVLLIAAMGLACVWAQRGSGTSGGATDGTSGGTTGGASAGTTGSTPGTATGTAPTTSVPATTTTSSSTSATVPKMIFLSGNVMMDDGAPLPASVDIQSVCGAVQRIVAHTSANGDFSFVWGNTANIFSDASQTGRIATTASASPASTSGSSAGTGLRGVFKDQLGNCDLRADLPGFRSSMVNLYNHGAFDSPDVGVIILHRNGNDEGREVSISALRAPKGAKKNFDKGTELARSGKPADAVPDFEKAVASYPEYADAWLGLGRVQSRTGLKTAARTSFQRAVELDDKLVGPWQELGYLASDERKWEEAVRYLDRALRLDPMDSMAWYFSALANYNLGRIDQAERSVRAEMKLDPEHKHSSADYLLGMVLIARQELKAGAELLRNYIRAEPFADEADSAREQLSRVESKIRQ